MDAADLPPTTQSTAAAEQLEKTLSNLLSEWSRLKSHDLVALNEQLRQANVAPLELE